MDLPKYVLCRPMGGLNDTLNQIKICWKYCEEFNRVLLIDTSYCGLLDDISHYFEVRESLLTRIAPLWLKKVKSSYLPKKASRDVRLNLNLDDLPQLHPTDIKPEGCLRPGEDYDFQFTKDIKNFTKTGTTTQITFDMECDHSEKVLIHHQCGGGKKSIKYSIRVDDKHSIIIN